MFIVELHQGCLAGRDRRDQAFYRSSGSTSGLGQTVTKLLSSFAHDFSISACAGYVPDHILQKEPFSIMEIPW